MRWGIGGLVAAALCISLGAGCDKKEGPIDGIGPWHIGKTVASEGTICHPQESGLTWCSHNPELMIAEHSASVDLYFRGSEPSAKLVEILMAMRPPCNPEAIDAWLTSRLGPAEGRRGNAMIWRSKAAVIAALLPGPDGECRVHFLDPADEARLAAIERESQKTD